MQHPLRQRGFAFLWASRLISRLGDWILDVALPIWVYQLTGSATLLGTIVALEMLPAILLSPLAGVYVDRWDRRRVLIWSNLLLGLSVLLLLGVRTETQIWIIFLVALINACLGVFLGPAQVALVPSIVTSDQLLQANSTMTLTLQGSRFVGPALGGAVIALAGPYLAFGVDAATFLLAALLILAIPKDEEDPSEEKLELAAPEGVYHELMEGLSFIRRTRLLWGTLIVWSIMMIAAGVVAAVLVVFVSQALGGSEESFGYLLATQGLGMVVGGVVTMVLGARVAPIRSFKLGLVLFSIIFLLGANAPNVPIAAVLVFGLGATMALVAISNTTIFQQAAPDRFRGRVLASQNAVTSLTVLVGALAAGVLTDQFGARVAFNLAGGIAVLAALMALIVVRTPPQHNESDSTPFRGKIRSIEQ